MYAKLYPEDFGDETAVTDMAEMEQIVPQTEADVDRLMADLAELGLPL